MDLKQKILQSAYELFAETGYENTTVADIMNRAGGSVGGFYHHFKSKDEILKTVIMSYVYEIAHHYDSIILDNEGSALELFEQAFESICYYKSTQVNEWANISSILSFANSHELLLEMATQFEKVTTEFYTKIIIIGNNNGQFKVSHPYFLANIWTREVIHIFRNIRKCLYSTDSQELSKLFDLVTYDELLFSHALGLKNTKINISNIVKSYISTVREQKVSVTEVGK